jgi:hypothetical protein
MDNSSLDRLEMDHFGLSKISAKSLLQYTFQARNADQQEPAVQRLKTGKSLLVDWEVPRNLVVNS